MEHQIKIHLTLNHSEEIRQLLEEKGFVTFKVNQCTRELRPEKFSNRTLYLSPNEYFLCLYNGPQTLEAMHISIKELEDNPAFIYFCYTASSSIS